MVPEVGCGWVRAQVEPSTPLVRSCLGWLMPRQPCQSTDNELLSRKRLLEAGAAESGAAEPGAADTRAAEA